MSDAIEAVARARLIHMSLDLKVQLERGTGTKPMLWLLASQRNKAVDAIVKMMEIDVAEIDAMRSLQAEVRLYGDMMTAAKELVSRGREADGEVNEEAREEIATFLTEAEARELGINQATED